MKKRKTIIKIIITINPNHTHTTKQKKKKTTKTVVGHRRDVAVGRAYKSLLPVATRQYLLVDCGDDGRSLPRKHEHTRARARAIVRGTHARTHSLRSLALRLTDRYRKRYSGVSDNSPHSLFADTRTHALRSARCRLWGLDGRGGVEGNDEPPAMRYIFLS